MEKNRYGASCAMPSFCVRISLPVSIDDRHPLSGLQLHNSMCVSSEGQSGRIALVSCSCHPYCAMRTCIDCFMEEKQKEGTDLFVDRLGHRDACVLYLADVAHLSKDAYAH